MTLDKQTLRNLLSQTIDVCPTIAHAEKHSGKVRESYIYDNGLRAIVVTDRISAFDYVLGTVPLKGQVLNAISTYWFQEMAKIGVPSHYVSSPHPNVSVNTQADVLPIEFIVRGYLTGSTITSSWYAYQHHDKTICGIKMPDNMRKNEPFPEAILTPTTKAGKDGRDENMAKDEIISRGIVPADIYEQAEALAMKMFAHGQKLAAEKGLILVDTKYEMGLNAQGEVIVVDEVHTPDSSRYWIKDVYAERLRNGQEPDSLDKEFVRNMIVAAGYDVDSDANPARYMTDDIRIAAAEKYSALHEIFLGKAPEIAPQTDLADVLNAAGQQ